jgi:site-specific recombinase XerD
MIAASSIHEPIANWAITLVESGRATRTQRRYRQAVLDFVGWFETQNHESFTPDRLTPIDLTGYAQQLQQSAATSTVNVHVCALRSFCGWLVEQGILEHNPAIRLKAVGTSEPLAPKALKPAQVNALLRAAQQTRHSARDYAFMQLLVQTGMRIGECSALRVGDIQLNERQGKVIIRSGKGNKVRTVPLNASARQALADYLAPRWVVDRTVKAVSSAWQRQDASAPLWYSQKGGALSSRTMSEVVEGLVANCAQRDLVSPDTTPHTLRHTFATNYLKDHPDDIVGLAVLLGHSSLETTRIYVQPSAEDLALRLEQTRLNAYS